MRERRVVRCALTVRLLAFLAIALCAALVPQQAGAAFWNPFDGAGDQNFFVDVRDNLRSALAAIEAIAGRTVSRFRLPEFGLLGFRPFGSYRPPRVPATAGFRPPTGFRGLLAAPSPRPSDTPSLGTICGTGDGDAWWAEDCSCSCGQPCPEDPTLTCEQCKRIRIGDRRTSQADCRKHGHPFINKDGGKPTGDFHF